MNLISLSSAFHYSFHNKTAFVFWSKLCIYLSCFQSGWIFLWSSFRTLQSTRRKLWQLSISRWGTCWPERSAMVWMQWTTRWRVVRPKSRVSLQSSLRTLTLWAQLKKVSTDCWISPKHWPFYRYDQTWCPFSKLMSWSEILPIFKDHMLFGSNWFWLHISHVICKKWFKCSKTPAQSSRNHHCLSFKWTKTCIWWEQSAACPLNNSRNWLIS